MDLVERLAPTDFDEFARQHVRALLSYAYVLCGDDGLAEDLVQEALLKLYRRWPSSEIKSPHAYVKKIIANDFATWWRRSGARERGTATLDTVEQGKADPISAIAERDELWTALGCLSRRQRTVLVLRYYEDFSDSEIARILGCRLGTVRSLASRGIESLRKQFPHVASNSHQEAR